jgi:hypothetical protein
MTPLDFLRAIAAPNDRAKLPQRDGWDGMAYVCRACIASRTATAVYWTTAGPHRIGMIDLAQHDHAHATCEAVIALPYGRPMLSLYAHPDDLWSTSDDPTPKPLAELAASLPLPFRVPA